MSLSEEARAMPNNPHNDDACAALVLR